MHRSHGHNSEPHIIGILESSVAACRAADTGPQGLRTLSVMKRLEQQCECGESTREHRFTLHTFQKVFPIVSESYYAGPE